MNRIGAFASCVSVTHFCKITLQKESGSDQFKVDVVNMFGVIEDFCQGNPVVSRNDGMDLILFFKAWLIKLVQKACSARLPLSAHFVESGVSGKSSPHPRHYNEVDA